MTTAPINPANDTSTTLGTARLRAVPNFQQRAEQPPMSALVAALPDFELNNTELLYAELFVPEPDSGIAEISLNSQGSGQLFTPYQADDFADKVIVWGQTVKAMARTAREGAGQNTENLTELERECKRRGIALLITDDPAVDCPKIKTINGRVTCIARSTKPGIAFADIRCTYQASAVFLANDLYDEALKSSNPVETLDNIADVLPEVTAEVFKTMNTADEYAAAFLPELRDRVWAFTAIEHARIEAGEGCGFIFDLLADSLRAGSDSHAVRTDALAAPKRIRELSEAAHEESEQTPCPDGIAWCLGDPANHIDPREHRHQGPEYGITGPYVQGVWTGSIAAFQLDQWDDDEPQLVFQADDSWPALDLPQVDQLIGDAVQWLTQLIATRRRLAIELSPQRSTVPFTESEDKQTASGAFDLATAAIDLALAKTEDRAGMFRALRTFLNMTEAEHA